MTCVLNIKKHLLMNLSGKKKLQLLCIGVINILFVSCSPKTDNQGLLGIWEGTLKYPGFESRIVFVVTNNQETGLTVKMLKPDEDDKELLASNVVCTDSVLQVDVAVVHGSFTGRIDVHETAIRGHWKQGRWSQPVVLKKVPEIVIPRRPQTPLPPFPYDEEEVTFTNDRAGVTLAGTLSLLKADTPLPAVILISGGGAHDRDYTLMRHRPFMVMADYLCRRGIAVLRFDDRGVGKSSGDRSVSTSADYALDVAAGVNFLKNRKDINPNKIGLIGHSEGGTIAALTAAGSNDIDFIVLMGSPGLPGDKYNIQYEESMGRIMGLDEKIISTKRSFQEKMYAIIREESEPADAEIKLRNFYKELSPPIPPAEMEAGLRRVLSPWFWFNIKHDPGATLRKVGCPVLALFGEKDAHVPAQGNLEAMQNSFASSGNKEYKLKNLAGLNHFFQTCQTGSPFEYGKIEETISPQVLELIYDWILKYTK